MKRIVFAMAFSLIPLVFFGQSFPGDQPELLVGKTVKPKTYKEELQKFHYQKFFLEFDKKKMQFTKKLKKNKPFPVTNSNKLMSDYSKLVGKEFKVVDVFEYSQPSYRPKKYVLEIVNDEIGTLYYGYDPKDDFVYELDVVGGIDFPEDFFCSKIEVKEDKFDDKTTYFTPKEWGISFMKLIAGGNSKIYLSVEINGRTANMGEKGLDILFEDGTKLSKPDAKIDVNVSDVGGYTYSTLIPLSTDDIKLLKEKVITDTRLYIYERFVGDEGAKKLREYLKCLL